MKVATKFVKKTLSTIYGGGGVKAISGIALQQSKILVQFRYVNKSLVESLRYKVYLQNVIRRESLINRMLRLIAILVVYMFY